MSNLKIDLPENYRVGDKIRLIDSSWSLLLPSFWPSYVEAASLVNIATFKVVEVCDNDEYILAVMDIVPEQGRVRIPAGLCVRTNLKDIRTALVASLKSSLT